MPKTRCLGPMLVSGALLLAGCANGSSALAPPETPTPTVNCEAASQEEWTEHCATAAPMDGASEGDPPLDKGVTIEQAEPTAGLNKPFQFFKTYSDNDEVEEWQVTLTKMKCGLKSIANGTSNPKWQGGDDVPEFITAKPEKGDEFCLLYWNWKNVGKTPGSTTSSGDLLIGDERYAMSDEADTIGSNVMKAEMPDEYYDQVDINPRKSTRSLELYSVPAGETPRAVLFPMTTVYEDSAMLISTT